MPTQSVVAASPEQIDEWTARSTGVVDEVEQAMREMGAAASASDIPAMRAACARIGDAGRALDAALPAPERDVTVLLRSAATGITDAEVQCATFSERTTSSQFDAFDDTLFEALNKLVSAAEVWGA